MDIVTAWGSGLRAWGWTGRGGDIHSRSDVIGLIVGSGLRWAIAGVVAGLIVAYLATRLMITLLFVISPTGPATFAAIDAAMIGVAIGASYIPPRRAAMVDPIAALRAE